MTTVATVWWTSIIAGGIATVDCLRRPQSAWVTADRRRSMWLTWIVLGSLLFVGIPLALIYLIAVVPLFSRRALSSDFDK